MQFKSSRKLTLSDLGHTLVFEEGTTQFVPPGLHKAARAQGLEAVLDSDEEAEEQDQPINDGKRLDAIKTAMQLIAERNSADDFTAGGLPKVRAIEALTDGAKPVDAKELQALWAEVVAKVGT